MATSVAARRQDRPRAANVAGAGAVAFPLAAVLAWGGQFPVAKAVLPSVNVYYLSLIRYTIAAFIFVAIVVALEGRQSLRLEGNGIKVFILGSVGIVGFSLLAFLGLEHTRPQNAALLVATMPMLVAVVLWVRKGVRPSRSTLTFLAMALAGVGLVISRGSLSLITSGQVGIGDLMVLGGAFCWVIFTLGAGDVPGWSPLRYTALSAVSGTISLATITVIATLTGIIDAPSLHALQGVSWQLAYMALPATVIAVLGWNEGARRLGPQNSMLFINLVPIVTFTIEIARGYHPIGIELIGAAVTIAALVASNLVQRRAGKTAPGTDEPEAA